MALTIYNTFTKQKEVFEPLQKGKVSFYACGVTVYDYCHLGHARAYVTFDSIRRYLGHLGYDVRFVQNFTDIDDKIIARSEESNVSFKELTETFIDAYFEDMAAIGVQKAVFYPRATDYISQMQTLIQTLLDKGFAYTLGEEVYFSVEKYDKYGQLSKKVLDELEAGYRVEVNPNKRNAMDFVLWKKAKEGEPSWDSPWGKGRPGWHIECSAMVIDELGPSIDIHAGGEDLIFPHHENEIAQSECATGKPFAKYWVHNGFVNIKDRKMSKSKKNFFTIRELLETYSGDVLRFFLMKVHYRRPLSFTFDGLNESKKALDRLKNTLKFCNTEAPLPDYQVEFDQLEAKFFSAMDDDFNTAEAIGVLFELNKLINKTDSGSAILECCGQALGLFEKSDPQRTLTDEVQTLIDQRIEAKKNKDFTTADSIRDRLLTDFNVVLEDTPEGVRWKQV